VLVGAKGYSNLPPRAQRRIWAGQIAALAGSDAILAIGLFRRNLKKIDCPSSNMGITLARYQKASSLDSAEYYPPRAAELGWAIFINLISKRVINPERVVPKSN
jgi:hypothetical protein